MAQTAIASRVPDAPKDPAAWSDFLRDLQLKCFVVGPVSDFRELPDGFEVRPNYVMLEVGADTFKVGTEDGEEMHAPTKSGIEKLALIAGAVAKATRTDDRRNPLQCEFEAVAQMKLLDGSPHFAGASRAYDFTPEGQDTVEVYDKAYEKALRYPPSGMKDDAAISANADFAGRRAVAAARATMTRNCETKSKLRALRTLLGLRSKYKVSDLRTKTFAILKLHFTGRSADPQTQRMMTQAIVHTYLGASSALFGSLPHRQEPKALAAPAEPTPQALPHDGGDDPPDAELDERTDETTGEVTQGKPVSQTSSAPNAPSAGTTSNGGPGSGRRSASPASVGRLVPAGFPGAGKSIEALDLETLKDLRAKVQAFIEAKRAEKVPEEKLAAVTAFLGDVELRMDALRPPAGPAPSDPEMDEWQRDYDAAGSK